MKKLFIIGCPRSGTTMLQQALNRHSKILIPPETKYFFSFLGQSPGKQVLHLRRLNADLRIDLALPAHGVRSLREARRFFGVMAQRYVQRRQRTGIFYFGDKTPEHTGRLSSILEVFPKAKVLFLYRDGRDVALSLTKVGWMHRDLYVNFVVWLYYYWKLVEARRLAAPNLCVVRYEDLATKPKVELRRILDFLQLRYESRVADGCGNLDGIPEREYAWKSRALQKISPGRIGTWQRELTAQQVCTLERLGAGALRDLAYELCTAGNHPLPGAFFLRLSWNLLGFVSRLPFRGVLSELLGLALSESEVRPANLGPGFEPLTYAAAHSDRLWEQVPAVHS
jgi:hypothetical protein